MVSSLLLKLQPLPAPPRKQAWITLQLHKLGLPNLFWVFIYIKAALHFCGAAFLFSTKIVAVC